MMPAVHISGRLVNSPWFEYFIIVVIVYAVLLDSKTSPNLVRSHGLWFDLATPNALGVFNAIIINNRDEAELERLREMEAKLKPRWDVQLG